MHPSRVFHADPADALDRAAAIGFAHVFAATTAGPMVVHAPVTRHGDGVRFHVARANRLAPHLDGAAVLVSAQGPQGYVSPGWYAAPGNQVPTWNFVAVEIDGTAAVLGDAGTTEHLDALAAGHEPLANPAAPWTRGKMDEAAFRRLLAGIVGFEVVVAATRTTAKLSQNKPPADRAGVVVGLRATGNAALLAAMEQAA